MKESIINKLIKLSLKSAKHGDVPVGAIIVKNNKIISKGYNTRVKKNSSIAHAEINAILRANKKLKNYFLYDCDLYVTLKPCSMCENVIKNARIKRVFYLIDKLENKKEFDKIEYVKIESYEQDNYKKILSKFFNNLRK